MSEFKAGDRVRVVGYSDFWDGREGTLREASSAGNYWAVRLDTPTQGGVDPLFHPEELEPLPAPDPVNHPAHYTQFPVEVIDITEHLSFNLGNVVKYACRAGRKDGADPIEDLRKMLWYGQRELERLTKDA